MSMELLSPAGDGESLRAAVLNGADAVYFGGRDFNARKAAKNFPVDSSAEPGLSEMIDFCHLHGVKAYITINTVYYRSEFTKLLKFAEKAYSFGADAFIVCDLGLISILSRYFKDIPLHASTQLSAHSLSDVLYLESLGISRVNLSRETPLKTGAAAFDTLNEITEKASCEIEIFSHGALCVSYSGRCLMSARFGGRSGNRGDCAQCCRQKFTLEDGKGLELKTGYLLSMKDLCTAGKIPELLKSGARCLKIEGRMKSPQYCAVTTRAYREAIDAARGESASGSFNAAAREKELLQVFNRGGDFTPGYYFLHSGLGMMSHTTPKASGVLIGEVLGYDAVKRGCTVLLSQDVSPGDGIVINGAGRYITSAAGAGSIIYVRLSGAGDEAFIRKGDLVYRTYGKALTDEAQGSYAKDRAMITVSGRVSVKSGERAWLALEYGGIAAEFYANVPDAAKAHPLTREELVGRLSKTGGGAFSIDFKSVDIDGGLFMPAAAVNNLRRGAVSAFTEKFLKSFKREIPKYSIPDTENAPGAVPARRLVTVLVSTPEQFAASLKCGADIIYAETGSAILQNLSYYLKLCRSGGKSAALYAALPYADAGTENTASIIRQLGKAGIDGFLARTLGQIRLLKDSAADAVADHTLNILNPYAAGAVCDDWSKYSARSITVTLSTEMTENEASGFGKNSEAIIYGKIPVMITRQCPAGNYAGRNEGDFGPHCRFKGDRSKDYYLRDRKGLRHTLQRECDGCVAYIMSQKPVRSRFWLDTDIPRVRLQFTDEDKETVLRECSQPFNAVL